MRFRRNSRSVKPRKGSTLREFPILVVVALVVSIIVKTFFIQFFYIPSGSMENTLQIQDRVGVNKFGNFFSEIKRGEVVVFRDTASWLPEADPSSDARILRKVKEGLVFLGVLPDPSKQYLIKRVIGVGGDRVVCTEKGKKLIINKNQVNEPYVYQGDDACDTDFDVTVPKGFLWVMGDHRGASADSRFHTDDPHKGMVPLSALTGRATIVLWPPKNAKIIKAGTDLAKISLEPEQP